MENIVFLQPWLGILAFFVGIVGIFIFMSIFFLMIKGLEKWFPYKDGKQNDNDEIGELDGE